MTYEITIASDRFFLERIRLDISLHRDINPDIVWDEISTGFALEILGNIRHPIVTAFHGPVQARQNLTKMLTQGYVMLFHIVHSS